MARSNAKVWLGFEDEFITEKYKSSVNFTTNKIGGKPDFPLELTIENPSCELCQFPQPLIIQIYAPVDNSTYHRTLYLFGCINPSCWNQSQSWTCIRTQCLEQVQTSETSTVSKTATSVTDWCQDADDWSEDNGNCNEPNGNVINAERGSDEDDESYSFEESVRCSLGNLTVDDQNANTGIAEAQGGAVGRLLSPAATAEIEGDEGEVVTIDTPTIPQHNIAALLMEVTPLPPDLCQKNVGDLKKSSSFQFVPYFMNVWEEVVNSANYTDHHVRELLQEYQQNSEDGINFMQPQANIVDDGGSDLEKYEKASPAHGDKMFHHFLTRIQMNPGQILRYNRDGASPLLISQILEVPKKCKYCQGDMIFEFQLLPTIISKLRLSTDAKHLTRIEFGNVLVFTCKKSCWSTDSNMKLETVIVQSEVY